MAAGWAAYFVINFSLIRFYEDVSLDDALLIAVANVVPPALVGVVVALNRRRLLRPEWGILRTIGVHLVVGVLFALATAALAFAIIRTGGAIGELAEASGPVRFSAVVVSSFFLYVIFFGFLMWSESVRRIQESQRMAVREAVLRAEAEARAVRAQFNPHFVFNTLHSLMLLVRSDPALAERAIEDVATLIRYATVIQRRDIDAVPLSKELEIARRYVALERLRLQDRLTVSWSVDVDPDSVTIPAFALQTLVENAIKHGIEPLPEGGRVQIHAGIHDGELEISVRDDGHGADPKVVEAAERRGLDLLRDRLGARYGDRGTLSWETSPDEGFHVVLRLPEEDAPSVPALDVIIERSGTEPPRRVPASRSAGRESDVG